MAAASSLSAVPVTVAGARLRPLLAALLVGAAIFSLDVLRASPREHLATVVLLSFASAMAKFVVWGGATVLIWRLCRRVPLDGRPRRRTVGLHLGAALGISALVTLVSRVLQSGLRGGLQAVLPAGAPALLRDSWTGHGSPLGASLVIAYPWDVLTYWAIFAGIAFWQWTLRAREREDHALALAGEVSRARLHALEIQLQPHFLFNALNTVSALLERNPAGARAVARGLRGLLARLLAAEAAPVQPLRDEVAFLHDYIAIQRARFGSTLAFELEVDPGCAEALVPSLLLQPLVENAVRHGASRRPGPSRIRVRAWRAGEQLELEVHDDGPGAADQRRGAEIGGGIGLHNTEQRLRHIHGQRARLVFEGSAPPWGGALVRISLPLEHASPPLAPATAVEPVAPQPPERVWLIGWLLFAVAMFVLNLIWSSARYLVYGRPDGLTWTLAVATGARGAAALVLLFPLVHWANRRIVARAGGLGARLVLHALFVVMLSIAKSSLIHLSMVVLGGPAVPPSIYVLVVARIYADVLHYALMAGLSHALVRYREHREQVLRAARLQTELAAARFEALRLRLEPEQLFATLDRLDGLIVGAPREADCLVAELGERLRRLLRGEGR